MDASGGVEAGTERAIALGRSTARAALFVITRCERENADPSGRARRPARRVRHQDRAAAAGHRQGRAFRGYVDLVHRKAYVWDGGKRKETAIPADLADEVGAPPRSATRGGRRGRRRRADQVPRGRGDQRRRARGLPASRRARLDPGAGDGHLRGARHRRGRRARRDRALSSLARRGDGRCKASTATARRSRSSAAPTRRSLARVFKTTADPFVGRLTTSASSRARSPRTTTCGMPSAARRSASARCCASRARTPSRSARSAPARSAPWPSWSNTYTGDALSSTTSRTACRRSISPSRACPWPSSRRPRPTSTRWARRSPVSSRRSPSVRVERKTETGEQLLWAHGENHVAVITERLKRKFGAAVVTRPPRIPYRETIRSSRPRPRAGTRSRPAAAGSSATCGWRSSPTRAAGVEFTERVVGGSVPRQFWAGVEKGVRDVAEQGPLAGYPVIDFKATLYDGSFHTVDSDELSFRLAGQLATKQGHLRTRRPCCWSRSWTSRSTCPRPTWAT